MSDELQALAREAAGLPGFSPHGMTGRTSKTTAGSIVRVTVRGRDWYSQTSWGSERRMTAAQRRNFWPDLTDPATGGCTLHLLGPNSLGGWEVDGHWEADGWTTSGQVVREGATLAEACARVAVALGRWPGGGDA